jgi:hypothetical protein
MKYLGAPQSGSQANTTASHNRAGQYYRNRRTPVSPTRTPKQGVLRTFFAAASSAWQLLDAATQAAWTSFAAGYPIVDALGQSIVLTGHQFFVGVNTTLLNAGQAIENTVPTNTTVNSLAPLTIYVDSAPTVLLFYTAPIADDFALIGASKTLSNGRNFNKQFSQFGVDNLSAGGMDITTAYVAQYGAPVTPRKIFARGIAVNSNGLSGSPIIVQGSTEAASILTPGAITSAVAGTVALATADVTATRALLFQANGVLGSPVLIATQPVVTGAATFTGVLSGASVFARVTQGVDYSIPTNTVVVM